VKILHLINTLSAGGAELHLLTLCRHLKKCNVEVAVACLREHVKGSRSLRREFERDDIRVLNLQADSRYASLFIAKVARIVAEERPHILHTHLPRADFAGAFARVFHPQLVWVCSVHDIYSESWAGRWSLPVFDLLWRRADVMLCISHAVSAWLNGRGVPTADLRVIHYGIEAEKFLEPTVDFRKEWGLDRAILIGSIGRLEPRKGQDVLIRAMPELCRRLPNARLLIAGHDPWGYKKTLLGLIEALNLNQTVRLVGFQDDVASLLNAVDVFALPSHSEGFGQILVEAMAAGKPVVASRIAPLTEIAVDQESALFVEPGNPSAFADALYLLATNPEGRRQMGARGRRRVEEFFAARRMAQETSAIYEEMLRRKQGNERAL
jgi:glycosyltransferase involved in cell wall biosynthesis